MRPHAVYRLRTLRLRALRRIGLRLRDIQRPQFHVSRRLNGPRALHRPRPARNATVRLELLRPERMRQPDASCPKRKPVTGPRIINALAAADPTCRSNHRPIPHQSARPAFPTEPSSVRVPPTTGRNPPFRYRYCNERTGSRSRALHLPRLAITHEMKRKSVLLSARIKKRTQVRLFRKPTT